MFMKVIIMEEQKEFCCNWRMVTLFSFATTTSVILDIEMAKSASPSLSRLP